jgi:hypothetical protein
MLLGLLVFPRVLPSEPDYEASTEVDVRPLSLQVETPSGGQSPGPSGAPALTPDLAAAQSAIKVLGEQAGTLRVLKGQDQARWAPKLAAAIQSSSIAGTSQVQVRYADDDPVLARKALEAYLQAYVTRRNGFYDRHVREVLETLGREARVIESEVRRWSRQADQESGRGSGPSVETSTQLELTKERYAAKTAQIDDVSQAAARNQNPTRILDQVSVLPSDNAGNSGVAIALGLLLGIMSGLGLAFLAEAIVPMVVTPADVQAATGLSVLAAVPRLPRRHRGTGIIVLDQPFSPAAEGYRRVSAALERRGLGGDIRVLAIASSDPGDG